MRPLLALLIAASLLPAQIEVQNAKLINAVIGPTKQLQIAPAPTVYSTCGQRPAGVSVIVYDTSFLDSTCTTRSYKLGVQANGLLHDLVTITGPAQAGFSYPLAALRTGGQLVSGASAGVAYIDPGGTHLLFQYQSSAKATIDIDPGGGYSYYLAACNGVPCTSSNYAFIATGSNWPTLTAGIAACNTKYGASTGCPMVGVLDAFFPPLGANATGALDINHIVLTVLEIGGTQNYWATYIANVYWPATGAPSITAVNFRYTPSDAAYATQWGTGGGSPLTNCPHYLKTDGATVITYSAGVPQTGTIFYHAALNTYSSNFTNCETRGAAVDDSTIYGYNIATATATLLDPSAQVGQVILNSQTGLTCAAGGTCDANDYHEFPLWLQDVNKLLYGNVRTSPSQGHYLLNGNMHMEFFVSNVDGTNPYQVTSLNNFGTPGFKAYATCGYAGIAKPFYDPVGQTLLAAIATCQAGSGGYNISQNWIVRWPLNYPGNPIYN